MQTSLPALKPYRLHLRETLVLSLPVIVGQIGNLALGITDNIMVGYVSYLHLSAASLANSCYFLITILAIGSMNVIAPLVAEAEGASEPVLAGRYLEQGLIKSLIVGFISMGLTLLAAQFLPLLGQPPEEIALAQEYLRIISFSTPPLLVFIAYKQFCDGLGDTRIGMLVTLGAILFNAFGNWLLIFGHWGLPRFELAGSGYATTLSRILMAIVMMIYVHRRGFFEPYIRQINPRKVDTLLLGKLFRLGLPMGLQIFFEVAAFSGAAIMIGWLPNDATSARAAHQIVLNISGVSFMVTMGIAVGASIRVGNALGAGDKPNLRRAGNIALAMAAAYMLFSAALMVTFRHVFPLLYGIEEVSVLAITARLMVIAGIFQLFDGTQAVAAGLLRGLQDVRYPTWVTFLAYWVIWIPLAYALGFTFHLGVDGIWIADIIALAFAAIMLTGRFLYLVKK